MDFLEASSAVLDSQQQQQPATAQERSKRRRRTHSTSNRGGTAAAANNAVTAPPVEITDDPGLDIMDALFGPPATVAGDMQQTITSGTNASDRQQQTTTIVEGVTTTISRSRLLPEVELTDPFAALTPDALAVPTDWPTNEPLTRTHADLVNPLAPVNEKEYYIVAGLTHTVPNNARQQAIAERALLTAQLGVVSTGIEQWRVFEEYAYSASEMRSRRTRQLANECFRRLVNETVPQVTTLKPREASEALNTLWKRMLVEELFAVLNEYRAATLANVPSVAVANVYIDNVADVFLRHQLENIEQANYDERPLLISTLEQYFAIYLTNAMLYLTTTPEEAARRPARSVDEQRLTCYYASVIEQYARPEFRDIWFPRWVTAAQPTDGVRRQLYRWIDRLVRARASTATTLQMLYTPMSDKDARAAFREMLTSAIALIRANGVVDQSFFIDTIDVYLRTNNESSYQQPRFVLYAPANIYELIDRRAALQRLINTAAYAPRPEDDGDPALADRRRADAAAAEDRLVQQVEALEDVLTKAGRSRARIVEPHAPNDPPLGNWSPYDLSYPLDSAKVSETIGTLKRVVATTAADFDASSQQQRAHDIRRALDQHYTMQLLERRRSEIQYRLDAVLSETIEVPLVVVRDLDSHVPALELRIQVRLAPKLEQRILSMSESLLEQEELDAQIALSSSQFEAIWYHRLPARQGVPGGGTERVVRRALLPVGGIPTDSLRVEGDDGSAGDTLSRLRHLLMLAGEYRVEVRHVADNLLYKTPHSATFKVVAHCARDNTLFTPLYNGFASENGTCQWHQHPPSEEFCEIVDELAVLVERGPAAHQAMLRSRASSGLESWRRFSAELAPYGVTVPPPLPPWGRSDGRTLRQRSFETRETSEARFTFERIYHAFIKRVGALIRGLNTKAAVDRGNVAPIVEPDDETMFLNVFLSRLALLPPGKKAEWQAALRFPSRSSVPTERNAVSVVIGQRFVNSLVKQGVLATLTPLFTDDAARDAVVARSYQQDRSQQPPFAVVLELLAMPALQELMTEREITFFTRVARDFQQFALVYREQHARSAIWAPAEEELQMRGALSIDWRNNTKLKACLDEELASLSIEQIRQELRTHDAAYGSTLRDSMFVDRRSLGDYEALLQRVCHDIDYERVARRCLKRQLPNVIDVHYGLTNLAAAVPDNGGAGSCAPTVAWIGTHTVLTDQPTILEISFSDDLFEARVSATGSQPTGKNVDFDGLRNMVRATCTEYTAILQRMRADNEPRDDVLNKRKILYERCIRAALIYNYFAFAAPVLGHFREAHALVAELEMPGSRLQFRQPLPVN